MQQAWLRQRLDTFLPPLMRKHGLDMWVVPMREYAEDPVFSAITAPETFAARRRTIYVFFDTCAAAGTPPAASCVQRIALGGTSQGGVFEARRSTKAAAANVGRGQQAELWGDEQWQALKSRDRGAQARGHRHQPLHRVRVLRRPVERRAPGHERSARRTVDREVQETRKACRSSSSPRACRKRKPSSAHAGTGLVHDPDDVLVGGRLRRAPPGAATWCGGGGSASTTTGSIRGSNRASKSNGRARRPSSSATTRSSSMATCSTATSASRWRG